jgi:hypothetical protein
MKWIIKVPERGLWPTPRWAWGVVRDDMCYRYTICARVPLNFIMKLYYWCRNVIERRK